MTFSQAIPFDILPHPRLTFDHRKEGDARKHGGGLPEDGPSICGPSEGGLSQGGASEGDAAVGKPSDPSKRPFSRNTEWKRWLKTSPFQIEARDTKSRIKQEADKVVFVDVESQST